MTIVKNMMDKLSVVTIIFILVDKLSLSMWTSYLTYNACFVSKDICVDYAYMSKWKP
jgi:uncharacterized membrane protein